MDRDLRRELIMRAVAVSGAVVSLVAIAVIGSRQPDATRVRARHDVLSPSGKFIASVHVEGGQYGREWRPVVTDHDGRVLFRAEDTLADKPMPLIFWEDHLDTLWVCSPGTGKAFVQEGLEGWTSTTLPEADAHLAPEHA